MPSQFGYHDPSTQNLLIASSYLYLLNVFEWIAQHVLSAGLLGQIAIGIIFGSPLAEWLDVDWQRTFVTFGYIGLLLLVFEGGISTSLGTLTSLLPLSALIALTGLLTPIALSFALTPMFGFPLLHSFAAGATLSSTSLGTSLAVLKASKIDVDLQQTRLGTVLMGAAIMDDVVAFVLSEIIVLLGNQEGGGSPTELGQHIGRIIGVTIGVGVLVIPLIRYVIQPILIRSLTNRKWRTIISHPGTILGFMTVVFVGMIAATGYGGTSPLYGVYIGGLGLSYLDQEIKNHERMKDKEEACMQKEEEGSEGGGEGGSYRLGELPTYDRQRHLSSTASRHLSSTASRHLHPLAAPTGLVLLPDRRSIPEQEQDPESIISFGNTFDRVIGPPLALLLLPLFFGSIGYSIPFLPLWKGKIIWKGIIYSLLMFASKLITGVWILIWPSPSLSEQPSLRPTTPSRSRSRSSPSPSSPPAPAPPTKLAPILRSRLPPALLIGLAMVARGEIGLLISQIALNTPDPQLTQDEFLVVTWAIALCTIIGPIGVGRVVRAWKEEVVRGGWGVVAR